MERYDEYKDSGVEWIGEIPAGWEVARIGQVTSLSRQFDSRDNRYVGLENIESWTGRYVESDSSYDTSQAVAFDSGDVLFGKLRPYLAKVFEASFSGLCSSELLPLTPRRVDGAYLSFCLRSPRFIDVVNESTCGTKMPRANWQYIRRLQIPLPPRNVQAAIASFLRSRTYEIDGVIADCEREVELLLEYRKAVISETVTKGLDSNVPMKASGIDWIGAIPVSWETARLDKIAARKSGHTPDKKVPEYWDGDIVWVSLADSPALRTNKYISTSTTMTTREGIAHSSAEVLPAGSVLLSRDASVGLTAIAGVPLAVSQHFMAYICGDNLSNEYLRYVFLAMHQEFGKLSMGSTIPTIGLPLVKQFVIPYPQRKVQDAIATYLDEKTAEIDALIADYQSMADKLREYRKSLISEAVTGKFKVPRTESR